MFTINEEMDLFEFAGTIGFWSGAEDRWEDMTEDEKEYLNEYIDGVDFESITAVNDFVWFESDDILVDFREQRAEEELEDIEDEDDLDEGDEDEE